MSQCLQQGRGRTQEKSLSRGPRNFKNHLKDPVRESEGQTQILSSSKQIHCAPAEWKGIVSSKSETLPDPSRVADDALKSQIITQMKRHTVLTSATCKVNMGTVHAKAAGQSFVFKALPIEGMDNSVEDQMIIPGYIEHCM